MDPRRRFTRAATCTAFCLVIAAAALSCRANPVSSHRKKGPSDLEISVGGVVPPTARRGAAGGRASVGAPGGISPAILPTTASISVSVYDEDEELVASASTSYSGGSTISLTGLPAEEILYVEVAALNAAGEAVTRWKGSATLVEGSNTLAATLAPDASAVAAPPATTVADGAATISADVPIPAGGARFYTVTLTSAAGGEYQILYDTGRARWAWMGVYDSTWAPLPVLSADPTQGWCVVTVPAGAASFNIALANSVVSPGYPAGALSGKLQARQATYVTPNGTGTGTSTDPSGAPRMAGEDYVSGQSMFARATDAFDSTDGQYTLSGDIRVYGGMSADWKTRSGRTTMTSSSTGYSDTFVFSNGTGCIDGFSISGPPLTDVLYESRGLRLGAAGAFVVNDCILSGNVAGSSISAESDTFSTGVYVELGNPEIASCVISGGIVNISNYVVANARGVYLNSPDYASIPYIHNCTVDGGYATSSSNTYTYGLQSDGISSVIMAGCTVWGGVSTCIDYVNYPSESRGISLGGSEPGAVVSSCVVSGGYNDVDYRARSNAVWTSGTQRSSIIGCTLDSGLVEPTDYMWPIAVFLNNDGGPNSGANCGNILLSSSAYDAGATECFIAAMFEWSYPYGFERVSGNSIISCDQEMYYIPEGMAPGSIENDSNATVVANNLINLTATPASWFRSYPAAPTTYAEFLAVDWRPAAASSSGETPADWGVDSSSFTEYPAVGLDLAGNARGYTTTWDRGAYQ